jgi:hypothetical protein
VVTPKLISDFIFIGEISKKTNSKNKSKRAVIKAYRNVNNSFKNQEALKNIFGLPVFSFRRIAANASPNKGKYRCKILNRNTYLEQLNGNYGSGYHNVNTSNRY